MSRFKCLPFIFFFFAAITTGCRAELESNQMIDQFIEPSVFSGVHIGSEEVSACTPTKPSNPEWQGMVISAPTLVRAAKSGYPPVVPICVTAVLPIIAPETPEILLVAVNRRTGKHHVGSAFTEPPPQDDVAPNPWPQPALLPHEVDGVTTEVSFSVDLAAALLLPAATGDYDVHMERGGIKSNTQTVRLEFPD